MALLPSTRLGPYDIVAPIGAGGMGEVYRATDTKLKREVAIKVLPESVAADHDRLARFRREAEVLASLNHPNIAGIYGLEESGGLTALVMELVEGDDLSQIIARGPIAWTDAWPIAKQIAEALEAAHDQGIVHRDLKPANIKVRADGTVKVLDFGLAKAMDPPSPGATAGKPDAAMNSPTMTSPAMTGMGVILGTAAYMSPEQAKGRAVDRRADIWAFGVVLYEMLTGRRAFQGEDVSDLLVAVLSKDVDLGALPPATPPAVVSLLRRCLVRDPKNRLRDIGEARLALESSTDEPSALPSDRSWREQWAVPALVVAGIAVLIASVAWFGRGTGTVSGGLTDVVDGIVDLGASVRPEPELGFALSLGGDRLAFVGLDESAATALWVRDLDGPDVVRLAGTERATFPVWSPDGTMLAFASDGQLRTIDLASGQLRTLCPVNDRWPEASWSRSGAIVFAHEGVIHQTDAAGSACQPVTARGEGDGTHAEPRFLPDGRHFTFRHGPGYEIRIGDLTDGTHRRWMDEASSLQIVEPDWVLYTRDPVTTVTRSSPTLLARRFDPATLALTGEPVVVLPTVYTPGGRAAYTAASNGVLVAVVDNTSYEPFVWVTRSGDEVATFPSRGSWTAAVSPSGRTVALGGFGMWLQDRGRDVANPLNVSTEDRAITLFPSWSPDERRLAFSAWYPGSPRVMVHHVDDGRTEMVFDSVDRQIRGTAWASDGRSILFWRDTSSAGISQEVWEYSLDTLEARALPGTPSTHSWMQLMLCQSCLAMAPHRRWLAYSASIGGVVDVYLRRNLETGSAVKVSSQGGDSAYWSADGRTIYYLAPSGAVMAVDVGETSLSTPRLVVASAFGLKLFGIADEGNLFLRIKGNRWQAQPLRLVINWPHRALQGQ